MDKVWQQLNGELEDAIHRLANVFHYWAIKSEFQKKIGEIGNGQITNK